MIMRLTMALLLGLAAPTSYAVPPVADSVMLRVNANADEQRAIIPADDPAAREEDAGRVYEALLTMPVDERTRAVVKMSPAMQSAVWTRHFIDALVRHPEFTTEQRAVIQQALKLMTPEFFVIEPSDARWTDLVDLPLRRLRERAMKAFPDRRIARDLFTQIGPAGTADESPDRAKPSADGGDRGSRPRVTTNTEPAPDCKCNTVSDFCQWSLIGALGNAQCRNTWCKFSERGCGALARYACEGLCFMTTS